MATLATIAPARARETSNAPGLGQPAAAEVSRLQGFVFALFFIFGGVTSLNDVVIPKLKSLFTLSHGEALLVQTAFFGAYFFVALPASMLVRKLGYLRGAAVGLIVMMVGCLIFIPASLTARFPVFLGAMFVLASGVTLVQIVANPLISLLGKPETVHSRLTFAQAFNSLGTTILPYIGALLILGSLATVDPRTLHGSALAAFRTTEGRTIVRAYIALAVILLLVAAAVWSQRHKLAVHPLDEGLNPLHAFSVLKRPRLAFGALAIFVYVGAEVAIGSIIVSYLTQSDVLGLSQRAAGEHVPFYWAGAMIGRFIGAYVLRKVSPGVVLAAVSAAAMSLLLISSHTGGAVAGYALLAVGLFNSIMFPTIFALACDGVGERAADASGVLCMAIVGGALVPPLTGGLADLANLRTALAVPGVCYAIVLLFGLYTARRYTANAG